MFSGTVPVVRLVPRIVQKSKTASRQELSYVSGNGIHTLVHVFTGKLNLNMIIQDLHRSAGKKQSDVMCIHIYMS